MVVPGLPTTGFFVLAASCFARSSPRFEQWVLSLPKIGPLVRDYRAGHGMPWRAKVAAVASMTVAGLASVVFALKSPVLRGVVLSAGAIGVWFVGWRIPTRRRSSPRRGELLPPRPHGGKHSAVEGGRSPLGRYNSRRPEADTQGVQAHERGKD